MTGLDYEAAAIAFAGVRSSQTFRPQQGDYLELLIEVLAKNVRPKSPTYTNHRSRCERAVPRICSQMHRSTPSRRSCRTFERGSSHERANHETRPTCQLAWRRRQADQCNRRSRLRRGGSRTAAKRWLISLRVSGIWSAGAGARACSTAAVTVRKAWASRARVAQRCQEVQVRTWCWSRPVSPLPVWKSSSTVHRLPATWTRVGQRHRRRRVAAVVGAFAGAAVPADQQPAVSSRLGRNVDRGPVVDAVAFGAGTGRERLPGPGGLLQGEHVGAGRAGDGRHPMVAGDGEDVAQAATLQLVAQLRVGAVDLVRAHPPGRDAGRPASGRSSAGPASAWSRSSRRPGRRRRRGGPGRRPSTAVDTAPGRSAHAQPWWRR